jgi:hypothetical protein
MKKIFVFLLVISSSIAVSAQTAEDSVKKVINRLFEAMKNSDAVLLKSTFADSAILQTISRNKEGNVIIQNEAVAGFVDFVSKQPKGAADERITYDVIKIDGPLAIAWTPYKFYFNGNFSHCGVNSFQLVKFNNEWKIQYLIDTRRRKGCE